MFSTSKSALGFLPLAALAALVACASGTGVSSNPTVMGCTSAAPPQLAYPAPAMTAVPTAFQLYVSYAANPGVAFAAPVVSTGSTTVIGSAWAAPGPGPTPPGTVSGAAANWVSNISGLAHATAYTIYVTNSACNQTYALGSFTTQ